MYSDLAGNSNVAAALRRMAIGGRVPHSIIFAGPDGVGKKQFALELARTLICREASGGESCGKCTACRRAGIFDLPKSDKSEDFDCVFLSRHPDVGMVLSPKRQIRVAAIRALESEANFRPTESVARVFIIDDADKMNAEAANALLKTLEEPPETTYLFLITSRPDALLPTIRSRCQMIRFGPVPAEEIREVLVAKFDRKADDAGLAARLSGGSIASAVDFDAERFRNERALCLDILRASIRRGGLSEMLNAAEALADAKDKERFENGLRILLTLLRDALAATGGGDEGLVTNYDIIDELNSIGAAVPPAVLAEWIWSIEDLIRNQDVNINRKVALDGLFVTMARV